MHKKLAIGLLPLVAIALVIFFAFRPKDTSIIQAPAAPDLNTDEWLVKDISSNDTLVVERNNEQRRVKLCGIQSKDQTTNAIEQLLNQSGNQVAIAFLGKTNSTWIAEVWVHPATEQEELLNGLLVVEGAARVDEGEWMSCPNQLSLETAQDIFQERSETEN